MIETMEDPIGKTSSKGTTAKALDPPTLPFLPMGEDGMHLYVQPLSNRLVHQKDKRFEKTESSFSLKTVKALLTFVAEEFNFCKPKFLPHHERRSPTFKQ